MKATIILYAAPRQLTKNHYPILIKGDVACWVRASATDESVSDALSGALPMKDEVVLNSVEVDVE